MDTFNRQRRAIQRRHQTIAFLVAVLTVATVLTAIGLIVVTANWLSCRVNWNDSAYEWRLKLLSCQVKHPTMGWIDEKRVRATD